MIFRSRVCSAGVKQKMGCVIACYMYINIRLRYLVVVSFALVKTGFFFKHNIKGTVSRDVFGFWCHIWLVLGLNRGLGHFKKFLGGPMILNAKSGFLQSMRLCWLNNVSGMSLVQVSLLLIGQQGLGHFFRSRPLHPIGWRTVQTRVSFETTETGTETSFGTIWNKTFVSVVSLLYRNREFRCFDWTETNRGPTQTVWRRVYLDILKII
jgi:hypothetical protein